MSLEEGRDRLGIFLRPRHQMQQNASKAETGGKIAEVELQIIQVDQGARSTVAALLVRCYAPSKFPVRLQIFPASAAREFCS